VPFYGNLEPVLSGNVTALLVAVVGVIGTLLAPVLAQRLFRKNRQLELDYEHRQRLEDREIEVERSGLQYRRDVYIRFNASARSFRQALKNRTFENTEERRAELELAREDFNHCYSEVQLVAPPTVLEAAHVASSELAMVYGRIKILLDPDGSTGDFDLEGVRSDLNGSVTDAIRSLRTVMRADLGTAPWSSG
jgi:hypothetical protein